MKNLWPTPIFLQVVFGRHKAGPLTVQSEALSQFLLPLCVEMCPKRGALRAPHSGLYVIRQGRLSGPGQLSAVLSCDTAERYHGAWLGQTEPIYQLNLRASRNLD